MTAPAGMRGPLNSLEFALNCPDPLRKASDDFMAKTESREDSPLSVDRFQAG
jgi:hypothetical protein